MTPKDDPLTKPYFINFKLEMLHTEYIIRKGRVYKNYYSKKKLVLYKS